MGNPKQPQKKAFGLDSIFKIRNILIQENIEEINSKQKHKIKSKRKKSKAAKKARRKNR